MLKALEPFAEIAARQAELVARKAYGDMPDYNFEARTYVTVQQWLDLHKALAAEPPECICNGGPQGEGLVSIPHEPHCPAKDIWTQPEKATGI